mmetsp:Transcript_58227/g.137267  ORF Transcript_58227/g.137267 Transcript_58227/m.137267 type:complete len:216 (+) Transcript_58227:123-770(+)
MSAKVRQQLRSLKENHGRLKELHATQAEKLRKKGKGPQPGEPDARAEIVDLISKHVQECEQLEKRRFGGGGASAAAAAAGARADLIGENMPPRRANKRTAEYTDLKDLDDPELDEGLKAMAAKDAELDADLDIISAGVGRLKNIALDMNEEIKMQNVMVDEITTKVDEATAHLQDLNKKLKDALDGAGGATMIIIRLVLFILLVAAAVYAYTLVK